MKRDNTPKSVEARVLALEKDLDTLLSVSQFLESKEISKEDILWQCKKCGSRIGIYDPKTEELRIRHKDFYAYWKAGSGGYLKLVCKSCSYINELSAIQ